MSAVQAGFELAAQLRTQDPTIRSPFEQIRIMTSGACGSSCDALTMSAYIWSKMGRPGPEVEYVAWGGNGQSPNAQNLTGTSFPGGGQGNGDRLGQVWIWYAIIDTIGLLVGDTLLSKEDYAALINLLNLLPAYPVFNDKALPLFSKFMRTQILLGENALPSELYIIPADKYIRKWFYHVPWGTDDPRALDAYDMVAEFFK
jgi:hypothetical protein